MYQTPALIELRDMSLYSDIWYGKLNGHFIQTTLLLIFNWFTKHVVSSFHCCNVWLCAEVDQPLSVTIQGQ